MLSAPWMCLVPIFAGTHIDGHRDCRFVCSVHRLIGGYVAESIHDLGAPHKAR